MRRLTIDSTGIVCLLLAPVFGGLAVWDFLVGTSPPDVEGHPTLRQLAPSIVLWASLGVLALVGVLWSLRYEDRPEESSRAKSEDD